MNDKVAFSFVKCDFVKGMLQDYLEPHLPSPHLPSTTLAALALDALPFLACAFFMAAPQEPSLALAAGAASTFGSFNSFLNGHVAGGFISGNNTGSQRQGQCTGQSSSYIFFSFQLPF